MLLISMQKMVYLFAQDGKILILFFNLFILHFFLIFQLNDNLILKNDFMFLNE
jgi:hypothetical protein